MPFLKNVAERTIEAFILIDLFKKRVATCMWSPPSRSTTTFKGWFLSVSLFGLPTFPLNTSDQYVANLTLLYYQVFAERADLLNASCRDVRI